MCSLDIEKNKFINKNLSFSFITMTVEHFIIQATLLRYVKTGITRCRNSQANQLKHGVGEPFSVQLKCNTCDNRVGQLWKNEVVCKKIQMLNNHWKRKNNQVLVSNCESDHAWLSKCQIDQWGIFGGSFRLKEIEHLSCNSLFDLSSKTQQLILNP